MAYYRKLIGEKVYLGPMNLDDAPLYTEWLNDPEVNCFLNVATTIISEHGEAEWLKQKTGTHYFRIGLMDDDRTIGNIGFVDPAYLGTYVQTMAELMCFVFFIIFN